MSLTNWSLVLNNLTWYFSYQVLDGSNKLSGSNFVSYRFIEAGKRLEELIMHDRRSAYTWPGTLFFVDPQEPGRMRGAVIVLNQSTLMHSLSRQRILIHRCHRSI